MITLYMGPMCSGKTTALLSQIYRDRRANRRCLVVKHTIDNRFTTDIALVSRDAAVLRPSELVDIVRVAELKSVKTDAEVIFIDEGQFFPDLIDTCIAWARMGKKVYIAALDASHTQTPFVQVVGLTVLASKVYKMTAWCQVCNSCDAQFTIRIDGHREAPETEVGDTDIYQVVCLGCLT
jgi:thymidine kinase